jgi:hypothetical protein
LYIIITCLILKPNNFTLKFYNTKSRRNAFSVSYHRSQEIFGSEQKSNFNSSMAAVIRQCPGSLSSALPVVA